MLNKYYPPDFDPSKIPRMKLAKNRQYTVRLMAPFNMRCVTCGEYIYKGKKFNARKEDVEGEDYLGIRIFRFYIKCTRCLQEISFRTDPKNTDYEIEAGATRNFMALKLAEEQAQREEDERIADEATNPMKLLENRTEQSKQELELIESLEELKDLNKRQRLVDYDGILQQYQTKTEAEQEQEDEEYIKTVFKKKTPKIGEVIEEIVEVADEEVPRTSAGRKRTQDTESNLPQKTAKAASEATPLVVEASHGSDSVKATDWNRSIGLLVRNKVQPLVKPKAAVPATVTPAGALGMLGSYSSSDDDND